VRVQPPYLSQDRLGECGGSGHRHPASRKARPTIVPTYSLRWRTGVSSDAMVATVTAAAGRRTL
jgi:hypothetical protein